MYIREYWVLFWAVVAAFALLVASPVLSRLLVYPRTDFFTELWVLDAEHKAENYPFNITSNQNYSVILGIGNRLGHCAYYMVMVKFRNESQLGPTSFGPEGTRVPSNVTSLFNMSVLVGDLQVWEQSVTFAFNYRYDNATAQVDLDSMRFNNALLDLSGCTITSNAETNEYCGYLFFETWLYRNEAVGFTYHERSVHLKFNLTI